MIGDGLAVEQRQRVGQHDAADTLPRGFGHAGSDHAAAAGADQDDVVQVLEEQHLGHLGRLAFGVDPRPELMPAFGAAIQRRREHRVPGGRRCGVTRCQIHPP